MRKQDILNANLRKHLQKLKADLHDTISRVRFVVYDKS